MFYDKVFLFFFMGKVPSGELSCMQTDLVLLVHTAWVGMSNHWYVGMSDHWYVGMSNHWYMGMSNHWN